MSNEFKGSEIDQEYKWMYIRVEYVKNRRLIRKSGPWLLSDKHNQVEVETRAWPSTVCLIERNGSLSKPLLRLPDSSVVLPLHFQPTLIGTILTVIFSPCRMIKLHQEVLQASNKLITKMCSVFFALLTLVLFSIDALHTRVAAMVRLLLGL